MHAHDAARRTPARPGGRPVASGRPGRWLACALLLACGCPCAALAADGASCAPRDGDATRPSVGLALGGGGARGVAHISVLRKLEAMGVPVDCIAGTSMGSLVGGLYASGVPVDELEQMVLETDWKQIFDDSIDRRDRSFRRKQDDRDGVATIGIGVRRDKISISPGVLQGERILSLFERRTLHVSAIDDFDRLPIPFRAIATDINTGEPYELSSGSLAAAMRASMSLPGIFQPMNLDGRVLIDGGVAEQVPIDAVRRMGADIVIAVDVGTPLATLGSDAGVLQVVSQLTGLLTVGNTRTSLAKLEAHDVLIVPALGAEVATGDFEKAAEALRIGRVAADDAQAALAALPRYASGRPPPRPERHEPVVEFVRLENESRYADAVLTGIIDVPVGAPVDADALEAATLRAYNLGTFASVTYEVVEEDGRTGVVVHAKEKAQGPNYLQAGFRLETDFSGTYESSLRLALLRAPVTENGAEARVLVGLGSEPGIQGEYYHPFDPGAKHYLYARLGIHGTETPVFDDDGNRIAIYDAVVGNAGLSLGRTFGVFGAAEVGLEYSGGQAEVQVGDPTLPDIDVDSGAWFASLVVDQVDSLHFPRDGYLARMKYRASVDWLGDGEEFEEVGVDALVAYPFGRHALQLGAGYHSTLSGVLPVHERYRVGGRGRLVGFHYNELTGQQFAVVMLGYMYEWGTLMGRSAVLGSTLEYGNAWEDRSDMAWSDGVLNGSVYAGFDSWIGPMLFGYGRREGGEGLVFIEIGKAF